MLDMLRLSEYRLIPESDDGLSFDMCGVSPALKFDIGSISSRSGLGIPNGAKSDSRNVDDAIRTVAAASEYDGSDSLSGRKEDDFGEDRFSSSIALNLAGNADAETDKGLRSVVGTERVELACVDIVLAEPSEVELSVPTEEALVNVSARIGVADKELYLLPGEDWTDGMSTGEAAAETGGLGTRFGSNNP